MSWVAKVIALTLSIMVVSAPAAARILTGRRQAWCRAPRLRNATPAALRIKTVSRSASIGVRLDDAAEQMAVEQSAFGQGLDAAAVERVGDRGVGEAVAALEGLGDFPMPDAVRAADGQIARHKALTS